MGDSSQNLPVFIGKTGKKGKNPEKFVDNSGSK